MARRLRLQYPGAIYHLMARGNGRLKIVHYDLDRDRLQEDLGKAAIRCSWRVYAEVVCTLYEIDPTRLSQRESRHPARAGLVYLARRHTLATNAELAAVLGLSRAESVPNLIRRFSDWLSTDAKIRKQLRNLEEALPAP
jgi:hypothetical protein